MNALDQRLPGGLRLDNATAEDLEAAAAFCARTGEAFYLLANNLQLQGIEPDDSDYAMVDWALGSALPDADSEEKAERFALAQAQAVVRLYGHLLSNLQ